MALEENACSHCGAGALDSSRCVMNGCPFGVYEAAPVPSPPRRVQLSRRKGWRMPANTVVVSRPSMWGNPFDWEKTGRVQAKKLYRLTLVLSQPQLIKIAGGGPAWWLALITWREKVKRELPSLRGKNLACWCPLDKACHADVLLKMANKPEPTDTPPATLDEDSSR